MNGRPRITYSASAGKENHNTKKFHTKKPIRKDVNNNNNNSNKDNSNNNLNSRERVLGIGEIVEKDKTDKRKKKKKVNNIVLTNNIKDQNKVDLSKTIIINTNPNKKEIDSDNNDDSDNNNNNSNSNNNNSNNNNNNKKRSESGKKMKNYTAPKSTTNSRARRSDLRKLNSESNSVTQGTGQVTSVQPPTL